MRADMAKVIVERPRHKGWTSKKPKGYARYLGKHEFDFQKREGIKRCWRSGLKTLNEHLGPLRRFLHSQVGRPWNKVFSEICANINRNSAVQDHVRDHVWDFVEVNVIEIDGVPCFGAGARYGRYYGVPLHTSWRKDNLYVCPRTGILKKVKVPRKNTQKKPKMPEYVRVDGTHSCKHMDGRWHLVTLAPMSALEAADQPAKVFDDKVLGRTLTRKQAVQTYGVAAYGVNRRLLGKKEMRQLPIPIELQR